MSPRPIEGGALSDSLRQLALTQGRSALQLDETVSPGVNLVDLATSVYALPTIAAPFSSQQTHAAVAGELGFVVIRPTSPGVRVSIGTVVPLPATNTVTLARLENDIAPYVTAATSIVRLQSVNSRLASELPAELIIGTIPGANVPTAQHILWRWPAVAAFNPHTFVRGLAVHQGQGIAFLHGATEVLLELSLDGHVYRIPEGTDGT